MRRSRNRLLDRAAVRARSHWRAVRDGPFNPAAGANSPVPTLRAGTGRRCGPSSQVLMTMVVEDSMVLTREDVRPCPQRHAVLDSQFVRTARVRWPEVIGVELVIVFVSVLALLAIENLVSRRSNQPHKELARALMPAAPTQAVHTPPCGGLSYDNAERALSAHLLAGQLDPADYRHAMARLAATDQRATGFNPLQRMTIGRDSRDQLAQLRAAMPALPPATIVAAISLAHDGATVENLTQLLGLTNAQALRVIVMTATGGERRD
jgi:hypothetical protein